MFLRWNFFKKTSQVIDSILASTFFMTRINCNFNNKILELIHTFILCLSCYDYIWTNFEEEGAEGCGCPKASLCSNVLGWWLGTGTLRLWLSSTMCHRSQDSAFGKLFLGAGAGLLFWWMFVSHYQGLRTQAQQPQASLHPQRKKRSEKASVTRWVLFGSLYNSSSDWLLARTARCQAPPSWTGLR